MILKMQQAEIIRQMWKSNLILRQSWTIPFKYFNHILIISL